MYLLLAATVLSFLSVHSTSIGKLIFTWINTPGTKEKQLISDKRELKLEQKNVSMLNEFAKYSKIQRKINAIDEELSDTRSDSSHIPMNLMINYGVRFAFGVILLFLSIFYRNTPVFVVDNTIDLSPFNYVISYPNESNVVTFHFWVLCCTAIARLIKI